MALLLYCIAEEQASLPPLTGSGALRSVCSAGVQCVYSFISPREPRNQTALQEAAVAFYRIIRAMFDVSAVIPFRFATVLEDEKALAELLSSRAGGYSQALHRHRDHAQMSIRITAPARPATKAGSGREFLEGRCGRAMLLESSANCFRSALGDLPLEWRSRTALDSLKLSALVNRPQVSGFRAGAAVVALPPGMRAVVSGPWPVTDFLPENLRKINKIENDREPNVSS